MAAADLRDITTEIAKLRDIYRLEVDDLLERRGCHVLDALDAGTSQRAIADELGCTHTTVQKIIASVTG